MASKTRWKEGYDRRIADNWEIMKVRIGIADTSKLVELDIEDPKSFKKEMERATADGGLAWFIDSKGREVGVPASRLAFVEIEGDEGGRSVGFVPAG